MHAFILASLLAAFVPSPETCSAQYPTQYNAGREVGFAYAAGQLGAPVDCDTVAATADTLTAYANRTIAIARLKPPVSACTYFGVGEAILEAVDLALVQCQGSMDR